MQRHRLLHRLLATALLSLSVALWAVLPLADSLAERAAITAVAHVEEAGSTGCPLPHEHGACQLCRTLRLAARTQPPAAAVTSAYSLHVPVAAELGGAPSVHWRSPNSASRAPPHALAV